MKGTKSGEIYRNEKSFNACLAYSYILVQEHISERGPSAFNSVFAIPVLICLKKMTSLGPFHKPKNDYWSSNHVPNSTGLQGIY